MNCCQASPHAILEALAGLSHKFLFRGAGQRLPAGRFSILGHEPAAIDSCERALIPAVRGCCWRRS
ncbi:MAG: hypothetical protein IID34_13515 [Planctomycetes bacterium]|nr:hypothetical protein [Planctomycetota bacterium]